MSVAFNLTYRLLTWKVVIVCIFLNRLKFCGLLDGCFSVVILKHNIFSPDKEHLEILQGNEIFRKVILPSGQIDTIFTLWTLVYLSVSTGYTSNEQIQLEVKTSCWLQ